MTTAADWVSEAELQLDVRSKPNDKLAVAISSTSATTLTVTYSNDVAEGQILAIDLELMYVWSYDETSRVATVERGWLGSTAATHAVGSIVYVNPTYPKFAIFRALNQELQSLASAGLFKMNNVELTYSSAADAYDLTGVTNIEGIYRVDAKFTGLTREWRRVGWEFARDQNTTDFASGLALRVGVGQSGQTVRVLYKSRFTALTDLASTKASTNLPESAHDIPPLGAAARLVAPREIARNDTTSQGDTRRGEEVPPGAVRASSAGIWAIRVGRIGEEMTALRRRYPVLT